VTVEQEADQAERELEALRKRLDPSTLAERLADAERKHAALSAELATHGRRPLRYYWAVVVAVAVIVAERAI
jgi:hypothetical protein